MTRSDASTDTALCMSTSRRARRAGTTHSGSYVAFSTRAWPTPASQRRPGTWLVPGRVCSVSPAGAAKASTLGCRPMTRPGYPAARRTDDADLLHGRTIPDPYRWLEDATSAETLTWTTGQDELLADQLRDVPGRDHLRTRIGELLGAGSIGTPSWRGERQFFLRRTADQEHAVLLTVDHDGADE